MKTMTEMIEMTEKNVQNLKNSKTHKDLGAEKVLEGLSKQMHRGFKVTTGEDIMSEYKDGKVTVKHNGNVIFTITFENDSYVFTK